MPVSTKNRTAIHGLINKQSAFESTNLNAMTKAKLLEFAKTIDLELSSTLTKKKLIVEIESSSEFQSYEKIRRWTI